MLYTEIRSPYIKSIILNTKWENHSIIDDLIKLEEYIKKGGPSTYIGNLHYASLKYNNHNHYLNLLKEIDIEKYNKVLIDLENEKKSFVENNADSSMETEQNMNDWLAAGGK